MTKKILTTILIVFGITLFINAQKEMFPYDPTPSKVVDHPFIDSTMLRVRYQMWIVNDVSKPTDKKEEVMLLQIGKKASKFFNFHRFLADSLHNALAAKKTPRSIVNNKVVPLMARTTPINIFKNYPEGKITTIDRVPFDAYRYKEDMQSPDWRLKQDTLTVCGYLCQKATTKLFGRNYTAWYAPEIAISDGPWKLFGLPGLILKAEDERGEYSFDCVAIEKTNWDETIYDISYRSIDTSKKRFFELQKILFQSGINGRKLRNDSRTITCKSTKIAPIQSN